MTHLRILAVPFSLALASAALADDRICTELKDTPGIYYVAPNKEPVRLTGSPTLRFDKMARFYIIPDAPRRGSEGVWHIRIFTAATTDVDNREVRLTRNQVTSKCQQTWSRFRRDDSAEDAAGFSDYDDFVNNYRRNQPILQNWNFDAGAPDCFNTADKIQPIELLDGTSSRKAFAEAYSIGSAIAAPVASRNRRIKVADLTAALVFKPSDDRACHSFAMPRTRTGFWIFGSNWIPASTKIEFWRLSNIAKEDIFKNVQNIAIKWVAP